MEQPSWMANVTHRTVKTNGINMHVVEQGTGPTVLLLHGFPEFWYSWRYQIPALAEAGFHVVAPDLRGVGQSDAPQSVEEYTSFHIIGDLIGLLDELGEKRVFVVGHDWGAIIAWDLCLFRPDRVEALVALSVPFMPRVPGGSMLQIGIKASGEGFYQSRFQEPGRAERDFERTGIKTSMSKMLFWRSSEVLVAEKDKELMESLPMSDQPPWVTDFDIQYYTEDKEKSGFTGGLNYYRCLDKTYELKAPWASAGVSTKALFIIGDDDLDLMLNFPGMKEFVEKHFKVFVPNLKDTVILEGAHFIQQEQSARVNELLITFFKEQALA